MNSQTNSRSYLKGSLGLLLLSALLLLLSAPHLQASRGNVELPAGFAILEIASGMTNPLDVEFLPSGELLVAEKGTGQGAAGQSAIRLIRHGVLQEEPVITLSTNIEIEAGIAGIVLDPQFSNNHYFYVWYATGENALLWSGTTQLRLSRFTLDLAAGMVEPESEFIMLDGLDWNNLHNGGGLVFDDEGYLYLSIGDIGLGAPAQDMSKLHGKVLRIRPQESGYDVPADNPFVGVEGAEPEIYSLGFRNPYRMTRRLKDDQLFLGDVGNYTWEEVDSVIAGANYGWPAREGPCPANESQPCDPAPPEYTEPVLYYPHAETAGGAITALAFYEGQSFPLEYQDQLFFAEFNSRYISVGDVEAGTSTAIEPFAQEVGWVVDMEYHKGSLYIVRFDNGSLSMIYYAEAENQPPSANLVASMETGFAPLTVTFMAQEVTDPDDIVFTYQWEFGDESETEITTSPFISHTYAKEGTYLASLKVIDKRGAESEVLTQLITASTPETRLMLPMIMR